MNSRARHLYGGCHSSGARIELLRGNRRTYYTNNNQDHTHNVPPDTDIIQESHKAHAKYIEHGNHSQDDSVDQQGRPLCCRINTGHAARGCWNARNPGMQQHVKGNGSAISDTCGDRDLADQVKPASIPTPGRPSTPSKTKLGRPVIETTGSGECRSQFSHAQRDDDHKDGDERPANRGGSKA